MFRQCIALSLRGCGRYPDSGRLACLRLRRRRGARLYRLQGSICGRLLARGADEMLRRRRWPSSALSARSPSFAPPAFAGQGDGSAHNEPHLAGVPLVNLACQGRVISSASHVVFSFLRPGGAGFEAIRKE